MRRLSATAVFGACLVALTVPVPVSARQHTPPPRPTLIAVPYLAQSPELCGGAALAMVLRYWGMRDVFPTDFSSLVDPAEGGIRASVLTKAVTDRGWVARAGTSAPTRSLTDLEVELSDGRPVIVLIEEGVTRYHYVVVTGFTTSAVMIHDSARSPFRVVSRETFEKVWNAADRWLMVVLPASDRNTLPASHAAPTSRMATDGPRSACEPLVQEHVALAKQNQFALAEAGLRAATEMCPADAAGWRELAGLKFVEKQYPESRRLAERAASLAPDDRFATELVAGARFLSGDQLRALDAWNRLGEPRIDLIELQGLRRTNHATIVNRLPLNPRQLLTPALLLQTERQTADMPTIAAARLSYLPASDGSARITIVANERTLLPRGSMSWAIVGLNTLFRREARLEINSPLREGEMWEFAYRFAKRRPRGQFRLALPSRGPLPGVTELEALWEGQFYGPDATGGQFVEVRRRRLHVGLSDWIAGWFKWQVGSSYDRFDNVHRFMSIESRLVARGFGDRVSTSAALGRWMPVEKTSASFTTAAVTGAVRSSARSDAPRLLANVGVRRASSAAPLHVWPVAGSSDTRGVLLRAHALFDDGVVNDDALGRHLVHGSVEYEQPVVGHPFGRLNAAVFVDFARSTSRRLGEGSSRHTDIGIGARLETPVIPGRLRLDLARGLRDGRTAVSAGIITAWGK